MTGSATRGNPGAAGASNGSHRKPPPSPARGGGQGGGYLLRYATSAASKLWLESELPAALNPLPAGMAFSGPGLPPFLAGVFQKFLLALTGGLSALASPVR